MDKLELLTRVGIGTPNFMNFTYECLLPNIFKPTQWRYVKVYSLTAKSVPAGAKLVLFGRYVLNIYVGIV
jgi:hypothetical protein